MLKVDTGDDASDVRECGIGDMVNFLASPGIYKTSLAQHCCGTVEKTADPIKAGRGKCSICICQLYKPQKQGRVCHCGHHYDDHD